MQKDLLICGVLALMVVGIFGQTLRHEFVSLDDDLYVFDNPHVRSGLTAENIAWATSSRDAANWHPLTWLTHILDCQFYGLSARGHHLTNVLLHAAAAVALFLVLHRMTGQRWPSAVAAALFAVHPLRVESVAWVAERKDVLSGLLFMLTLAAYASYVHALGTRPTPIVVFRYLLVVVLFALGLMAKPMLVTLPLVLLLLDYWPLGRFQAAITGGLAAAGTAACSNVGPSCRRPLNGCWRILLEKLPLLALSAASCVVTLWAQHEAITYSERWPLSVRLGNAAVSYVAYLKMFFYPMDLAVLYPHPGRAISTWAIVASVLALAAISGGAVALRRRAPSLLVGWLWYVGMLVPVVGLVQVGNQAMADRYTYLPQIGICVMLTWGVVWIARPWPRPFLACGAAATVTALAVCAWQQTSYWRDSVTLWDHAARCTEATKRNHVAYYNLGVVLTDRRQFDPAIEQYEKAVAVKPDYAEARYNLGVLLNKRGRVREAADQYRRVLRLVPEADSSAAEHNLGAALATLEQYDEAIEHYQKALRVMPDSTDTLNNLGNALMHQGRRTEAAATFQRLLQINPHHPNARRNLEAITGRPGDVP
jgi:protein O-mannosyl-transferase